MTTTHDGYGTVANITRQTGADPANAVIRDGAEKKAHSPWSSQVMILAGYAGTEAWLWLGCRNCGWFLGYSPQIDPDYLASAAKEHRDQCPEGSEAGGTARAKEA